MKKLARVLLVFAIISSCFAFVGCDWINFFGTTTTTTTGNPDPSALKFAHSDNFTDEDIEFVRSLHGYQDMEEYPKIYTFSEIVNCVNTGKGTLYYVDVDAEAPYYICGYIDMSIEENRMELIRPIDITKYTWYKYYDKESIPEEIENLSIAWGVTAYDAVIESDIGRGEDCNHKFRFRSIERGLPEDFRIIYDYMVIYYWEEAENIEYIRDHWVNDIFFRGHTDESGKSYFMLKVGNSVDKDGNMSEYLEQNRAYLENYYDVLCPYFERVEELDRETVDSDGEAFTLIEYGIPVDILTRELFGE